MRRLYRLILPLIGLALLASCASRDKDKNKAAAQPRDLFIGTVALVNDDARFVLIDQGQQVGPETGAVLKTYRGAEETAELIASAVRKRPFIIADIKGGLPQKGDRVFFPARRRDPSIPPPIPPPAQPSLSAASPEPLDQLPQLSSGGMVDQ